MAKLEQRRYKAGAYLVGKFYALFGLLWYNAFM